MKDKSRASKEEAWRAGSSGLCAGRSDRQASKQGGCDHYCSKTEIFMQAVLYQVPGESL